MALPSVGNFGPISTTFAKDLAALTGGESGIPCQIGATTFNAVPLVIGKEFLASLGIAGVRGTVLQLHVLASALPDWPLRAQTPITVNGQPMMVRTASLEGDETLAVIIVEQVA